jgi:hypothetical protein
MSIQKIDSHYSGVIQSTLDFLKHTRPQYEYIAVFLPSNGWWCICVCDLEFYQSKYFKFLSKSVKKAKGLKKTYFSWIGHKIRKEIEESKTFQGSDVVILRSK